MADERAAYAEQLLDVITDDVRGVSRHSVVLLSLGTFIAVIIASSTDEMLLRAGLVTLPLLTVQVPLWGTVGSFYLIAPFMLLVLHGAVLLQLALLGYRLTLFQRAAAPLEAHREQLCTRLPSFYTVQFLEGQPPERPLYWLSRVVTGLTVLLPLGLLLWIQGRFLPVHDLVMTGVHMGLVLGDAVLIFFLWPHLPGHRNRPLVGILIVLCLVCLSAFSFHLVATIPDQTSTSLFRKVRDLNLREKVLTANALPPEVINALSGDSIDQREDALDKVSPLNFLQGRDLRHANLFHAVLPRLDLRPELRPEKRPIITQLQGADLRWAQMQKVLLDEANLQGADLQGARVQGGILNSVHMQDATLVDTQLQGAMLVHANLQKARASKAKLNGADLAGASLEGADLSEADLRGANLQKATLVGANLFKAQLQGANLSEANLQDANLQEANLQGAVLRSTVLLGVKFQGAQLDLTDVPLPAQAGFAEELLIPSEAVPLPRCRKAQAVVFTQCEAIEDHDYRNLLTKSLLKLACDDAYIARGLSRQVLAREEHASQADPCLVGQVAEGLLHCQCPPVQLLPEQMRKALEGVVERSEFQTCRRNDASSPLDFPGGCRS